MRISKRRKRKLIGKGVDKDVHIFKEIDICNYVPIEYRFTQKWADFNNAAESYFRRVVAKTDIDELDDDMFDALIDAEMTDMLASAKEQYTHHTRTIYNARGIVRGQLEKATSKLELLNADNIRYDEEIAKYTKLKEERNIM